MLGKITKSAVEKLPLNAVLWDTALTGFGIRRQRRHVFYLLRYRLNGKQRFHSIGRHGTFTPDTARTEAKRLLAVADSLKARVLLSLGYGCGSYARKLVTA